jgi:hypothetical protein
VLVPAQEPLTQRGCFEREFYHLYRWFCQVEPLAWELANFLYRDNKPDKIFLVTEQTLTASYAITHKQLESDVCEIRLSANVPLPSQAEASALLQYKAESAQAGAGFEIRGEASNTKAAIFLKVHESSPQRGLRLGSSSAHVKVKNMFQ